MKLIFDLALFWLIIRWVVPIVILLALAIWASHWAKSRDQGVFHSAEPKDRQKK